MLYELLEFNGSRFANGSVMPSLNVRDAFKERLQRASRYRPGIH